MPDEKPEQKFIRTLTYLNENVKTRHKYDIKFVIKFVNDKNIN